MMVLLTMQFLFSTTVVVFQFKGVPLKRKTVYVVAFNSFRYWVNSFSVCY